MSDKNERPLAPMLPTEDGYLEYVAMNNEMTGAFPAVTEKDSDTYGDIYKELYGLPLDAGDAKRGKRE